MRSATWQCASTFQLSTECEAIPKRQSPPTMRLAILPPTAKEILPSPHSARSRQPFSARIISLVENDRMRSVRLRRRRFRAGHLQPTQIVGLAAVRHGAWHIRRCADVLKSAFRQCRLTFSNPPSCPHPCPSSANRRKRSQYTRHHAGLARSPPTESQYQYFRNVLDPDRPESP